MNKIFLIVVSFILYNSCFAQLDPIITENTAGDNTAGDSQTIILYDTLNYGDTLIIIKTILNANNKLGPSQYYEQLEKILDQKQTHYDSTLSELSTYAGILAVVITIAITGGIIFGFYEFRVIKNDLKNDWGKEREAFNSKLKEEAENIVINKYESDITELRDKLNKLEVYTQQIADSFVVKAGVDKPKYPEDLKKSTAKIKNPFDEK